MAGNIATWFFQTFSGSRKIPQCKIQPGAKKSNEETKWIPRLFPPQFHWYNEVIPNKQHNHSECQSMNQHIGPLWPRILQPLLHYSVKPLLCSDLPLPAKWNLPCFICRICHSTSFRVKKSRTNLLCIFQFCRVSNQFRHYKKSHKIYP